MNEWATKWRETCYVATKGLLANLTMVGMSPASAKEALASAYADGYSSGQNVLSKAIEENEENDT